MDEATETIILELQLQDLTGIVQSRKGKEAVGRTNDISVACQIQIEECKAKLAFLSDRRMSRSIAQAVQDDGPVVSSLYREENRSFRDSSSHAALLDCLKNLARPHTINNT